MTVRVRAWVESPLQAVNAVEYAAHARLELELFPRAGAIQLADTLTELLRRGVPRGVSIARFRGVIPFAKLIGSAHWVIGDPFSGQVRFLLALGRPQRLTLVDDGSMTLHLAELLEQQTPFERPLAREGFVMRVLGRIVRRSLIHLARDGRLELFSYHDATEQSMRSLQASGVRITANEFAWLRASARVASNAGEFDEMLASDGRVLLGSAAVTDGHSSAEDYLSWVRAEAASAPRVYAPHRRESVELLGAVGEIAGITVLDATIPIELRLAGITAALDVVTLHSSAVDTLARVLHGTGSSITLRTLPEAGAAS